jgi:hypothetical protein
MGHFPEKQQKWTLYPDSLPQQMTRNITAVYSIRLHSRIISLWVGESLHNYEMIVVKYICDFNDF